MSQLDSPSDNPPPEQQPAYCHKTWVRPGYHPASPPKKPRRAAHYPGPSPSRSDGGPALLSRMDLTDFPYSPVSKSTKFRTQKRHRTGRSLGNFEDSRGLTLGNHRVASSRANEAAPDKSPSPISGETDDGGTLLPHMHTEADDPDLIPGLHLQGVHDATGPVPSGSREWPHGLKLGLETSSELRHSEGGKPRNGEDLANSWSRPSLMERIAPLVKENALLRYKHDRRLEHNNPSSPLLHDKSVDAVMTSAFCDNLSTSLITCQSQLAREPRFNSAHAIKNPLNTELHVENLPPPAKSPPVPNSSTNNLSPSGSSSDITSKELTVTSTQVPQQPSIDTRIATDQSAIPNPIPIPSPIVSPQSSILNGFTSLSDMTREKYSANPRKHSRSPSPYARRYKRPRSRSPPGPWRTQDNGWNPRSRSPRSPSPSYHRLPRSPHISRRPSYSFTSHHSGSPRRSRSPHVSPYSSHPPTSPYKSRRSRSPHRREADTTENQRRMPDAHRGRRPPPASEGYSGGSKRQRYLTAFEREELEKAKRDEGREHSESSVRGSSRATERGHARSGSFSDRMSVDRHITQNPSSAPASAMTSSHFRSPRAPALSPAAGDSIKLCQIGHEQRPSVNGSEDGAVGSTKYDSQTRNMASVESAEAISKPGVRTKEVLPPWRPFGGIPGIWFLMNGSAKPEVSEHSFEISKEVASEWNLPRLLMNGESIMGSKFRTAQPPSRLSWKLKCVLAESVDPVRQRLEEPGTAENLVRELGQTQSHWPPGGKLIVEVNPMHASGQTFYAKQLDTAVPFVELQQHIHEGTNLIRFIQLGDLSKYVFILYATYCESSPQAGQHALDLDNLQVILQKSRLDKLPELSDQPLFGAHTAHISVTFNNQ